MWRGRGDDIGTAVSDMDEQEHGMASAPVEASISEVCMEQTAVKRTDSVQQARIIDAPTDDDVLVVAGAGSGKTYTMQRRITTLIERGVPAERIAGLTFTRKAAGELQQRVSQAVADMGSASWLKPTICTYDSFFRALVSQYGLLVGMDPNLQPLSAAGARQLMSDVLADTIDDMIAGGYLGGVGGDGSGGSDDASGEGDGQRRYPSWSGLCADALQLAADMASNMIGEGCEDMRAAVTRLRAWNDTYLAWLNQAIGSQVPSGSSRDIGPMLLAKHDALLEVLHDKRVEQCVNLRQTAQYRQALLILVEAFEQRKRERGVAQFSDFTIAAYQLVTRLPAIGQTYRERYSHVFLDEYQDTSTTQATVLSKLFHVPGNRETSSAVTAVGDPFQAIYAWRGASPGAFRMFLRDFEMPHARPYSLSQTRRNDHMVLDVANAVTAVLRSTPSRASSAALKEVDVPELSVWQEGDFQAGQGSVGVLRYSTLGQQIDGVVRFACDVVARYHTDDEGGQAAQAGSGEPAVAILFRSKTDMQRYADALELAGLRTTVVGRSQLLEQPSVRDVLALLRMVSDHTNSAAALRLLATPRFAMNGDDLRIVADTARRLDLERRFQGLVDAGLVSAADGREYSWSERKAAVREHAQSVPPVVLLTDVLLRDDVDELLAHTAMSPAGRQAVVRAASMIRRVHDVVGRPVGQVMREAIAALDADVDVMVAQAVQSPGTLHDPLQAQAALRSLLALVDTYGNELSGQGLSVSLAGFLAWLDADDALSQDEVPTLDGSTDVVLMTVHQSKGLEWNAVAVVDMDKDHFPPKRSGTRIDMDENHPGGWRDGRWEAPRYRELAQHSWISDAVLVPTPVRVDAGILPALPPTFLDSGDARVDEIGAMMFGPIRTKDGVPLDEDGEAVNEDACALSQAEEYGRRAHADERRLLYVALTRARHEVLVTCCASRSLQLTPQSRGKTQPSVFWQEINDIVRGVQGVMCDCQGVDVAREPDADAPSLCGRGVALPSMALVGQQAQHWAQCLVEDAWVGPMGTVARACEELPWPCPMSDAVGTLLRDAAMAVGRASSQGNAAADGGGDADDMDNAGPLTSLALRLCANDDVMDAYGDEASVRRRVRERGLHIVSAGRQNVTALQARTGQLSDEQSDEYWRAVVRPIPRIASPLAQAGTRFHDWAERFVLADCDAGEQTEGGVGTVSRASMLAQLQADEEAAAQGQTTVQPRELAWRRRLAQSRWARRVPVWAERQIVTCVRELDDAVVVGKLDAVFAGGLGEHTTDDEHGALYTIVDWKTGRKPRDPEDVARKLAQLDWYRLLLARMEGVPLHRIDATLYYVSEEREADRELHALAKTEREILDELADGIAAPDDND